MEVLREVIPAGLISIALIVLCVMIFFESLAHTWARLHRLQGRLRMQILLTTFVIFAAHTLCIWLFGGAYYMLEHVTELGRLHGNHDQDFLSYVYFSATTYSSLGFGDVYPEGWLRMIAAAEVIMGLLLIGWSVTFTYLVTQEYLVHRKEKHGKKRS